MTMMTTMKPKRMPKRVKRKDRRRPAWVVGLMSGTSGDGLDIARVRFDREPTSNPEAGELVSFGTFPYPPELAPVVRQAANASSLPQAESLSGGLSHTLYPFWRDALTAFLKRGERHIDLLVSHGQTLWHAPPVSRQWDLPQRWQQDFDVPVVANVRAADLAVGGQGAPLAPLIHAARFRSADETVAVLNLGGMANLTILQKMKNHFNICNTTSEAFCRWVEGIRGWDSGPGNVLMDAVVQMRTGADFDRDGTLAEAGQVDARLLAHFLDEPYFAQSPPKSTGRDRFGHEFADRFLRAAQHLSDADAVATASEITVQSVARELERVEDGVHRMVLCGGGAHNNYLRCRLAERCACKVEVDPHADATEAWLMAMIGWRTLHGLPSSIPGVTGASEAVVLGEMY